MKGPVIARSVYGSEGRGYVEAIDVTIPCGDITVRPNEVVFGDYNGIVVIPQEIEDEVLSRALEKVSGENKTRRELLDGKLLAEVYEKYEVL